MNRTAQPLLVAATAAAGLLVAACGTNASEPASVSITNTSTAVVAVEPVTDTTLVLPNGLWELPARLQVQLAGQS